MDLHDIESHCHTPQEVLNYGNLINVNKRGELYCITCYQSYDSHPTAYNGPDIVSLTPDLMRKIKDPKHYKYLGKQGKGLHTLREAARAVATIKGRQELIQYQINKTKTYYETI